MGVLSANTSRSVNVTCMAQKFGGEWEDAYYYPQMNPAGNPVPSTVGWIPADRVRILHNPHEPDPIPTCVDLSGCLKASSTRVATGAAATAGVVGVVAGVRRWRRRRS